MIVGWLIADAIPGRLCVLTHFSDITYAIGVGCINILTPLSLDSVNKTCCKHVQDALDATLITS